jgi:hypothetical protein
MEEVTWETIRKNKEELNKEEKAMKMPERMEEKAGNEKNEGKENDDNEDTENACS